MDVYDLLTHIRVAILDDARNIDYPEDNLWSDEELVLHLSEAEQEACIRAELLEDDTTVGLCVFAGHASGRLVLDKRILYVKAALWNGKELTETSKDKVAVTTPTWRTSTGVPGYWFPELNTIRLVYAPETPGELAVEVCRLPLERVEDVDSILEIPERHHLNLGHWVAHRAYLKQDSETYDPQKSKRHYDLFEAEFGPRKNARDVRDRQTHGQPQVNFARIQTS